MYLCANVVASANYFSCGSGQDRVCCVVNGLLGGNVSGSGVCHGIFFDCASRHFHVVNFVLCTQVRIFPRCHTSLVALAETRRGEFSRGGNSARNFIGVPLRVGGSHLSIFLHRSARHSIVHISLHSISSFPYGGVTTRFFGKKNRLGTTNKRLPYSVGRTITIIQGTLGGCRPLLGRAMWGEECRGGGLCTNNDLHSKVKRILLQ